MNTNILASINTKIEAITLLNINCLIYVFSYSNSKKFGVDLIPPQKISKLNLYTKILIFII
tara:strand:+ start:2194 stop:2376 length:183 start_codon:yes stop_codon:yes gene_type:complete